MPRITRQGNVRKICRCPGWKKCQHPWYVFYGVNGHVMRGNLDKMMGTHASDFSHAKRQAKAAIVAWLDRLIKPYELAREKLIKGMSA